MKNTLNTSFWRIILVCCVILIAFSCSDEKDMREEVLKNFGEPDLQEEGGAGAYKYLHFIYLNKNINKIYVFRKSAPGCGGAGDWYVETVLYASYYYELYEPPTITHAPVITAPAGEPITITAEITDDEQVVDADLFYRTTGTADSTAIVMTVAENIYTAVIPPESVTTAGVEYFIEASDGDHVSKLPAFGYFPVIVTAGKAAKTYAETESSSLLKAPAGIPGPSSKSNSSLSP